LQDDVVPYFHITPFLARRRRNIVYLNPMTHGTQNPTKSVHHPVVDIRVTLYKFNIRVTLYKFRVTRMLNL
jgi:hypothetical protein